MNTILKPRKYSLLLRITCLILLLGVTPFVVVGMHEEGKDYGIFFFVSILIILVPEIYIKLLLKPISAVLEENTIILEYYLGTRRQVLLDEIEGYSVTEEQTNYGKKTGLLLYLKNGKHVDFTEINIIDVIPLRKYLDVRNLPHYGTEKLRPWYSRKYKYNRPNSLKVNL